MKKERSLNSLVKKSGAKIPAEPKDLEPWERFGLMEMAEKSAMPMGRWTKEDRIMLVYSALCGIYRLNKQKHVKGKR